MLQQLLLASGQRERQRRHDALHEIVLQLEHVAQGGVRSV